MIRAALKGAVQLAFAPAPGLYRKLTRERLGTYATHVDKLGRVWPGYVRVWIERAGLVPDGARMWIHEAGETPFSPIAAYLLTGSAGVSTNSEGGFLDRYLARAVNGALAADIPSTEPRRRRVESLRWEASATAAVVALGGKSVRHATDLESASVDLCHSGGELEHLRPDELDDFLVELRRVLRPGGISSHVFDHRDHLHHADNRLPFLAHYAVPELLYGAFSSSPISYHSRLTPTEVAARFERAGFERICVRRMIYPERKYVEDGHAGAGEPGLPRRLLARRFRDISDEDLRTAACHYVYRRP